MTIEIRPALPEEYPVILDMSNALVDEGCCTGMVYDTLDSLRTHRILLALDAGTPIGYAYGSVETSASCIGHCKQGDAFYSLDELYVVPASRSAGVGQQLFDALRREAADAGCRTLRLTAVNKDWRRLLHFYVDKLGMDFLWATLSMDL